MPNPITVTGFLAANRIGAMVLPVLLFCLLPAYLSLYSLCPSPFHWPEHWQPFWLSAWQVSNKTISLHLHLNIGTAGFSEYHQALCSRPYRPTKMKSFQVPKVSFLKRWNQRKTRNGWMSHDLLKSEVISTQVSDCRSPSLNSSLPLVRIWE